LLEILRASFQSQSPDPKYSAALKAAEYSAEHFDESFLSGKASATEDVPISGTTDPGGSSF
jgi:hypothetical protein